MFDKQSLDFPSAGIIAVAKSLQRFSRIPSRTAVSLSLPTTSSAFVILCLDGKLFTLNSQGSQLVSCKISASWKGLFAICNPSFSSFKSLFHTFSLDEMKSLLPSGTGCFLPFYLSHRCPGGKSSPQTTEPLGLYLFWGCAISVFPLCMFFHQVYLIGQVQ